MSANESSQHTPPLVPAEQPPDQHGEAAAEMTPARQAALAALEREFRDLLAAQS